MCDSGVFGEPRRINSAAAISRSRSAPTSSFARATALTVEPARPAPSAGRSTDDGSSPGIDAKPVSLMLRNDSVACAWPALQSSASDVDGWYGLASSGSPCRAATAPRVSAPCGDSKKGPGPLARRRGPFWTRSASAARARSDRPDPRPAAAPGSPPRRAPALLSAGRRPVADRRGSSVSIDESGVAFRSA
jgi:hypothetical protein